MLAMVRRPPEPREQARGLRAEIVGALSGAPGGLTVGELHEALGGSDSALRRELAALSATGAVMTLRDAPAGPGRPTLRFQLAPVKGGWTAIVNMLVGFLGRDRSQTADQVFEFGREQGAALLREPSFDAVIAFQAELGFSPRMLSPRGGLEAGDVTLRFENCPLRDAVASEGGRVVCSLHHGLLAGQAAGAGGSVERFEPQDPYSAGCLARLRGVEPGA